MEQKFINSNETVIFIKDTLLSLVILFMTFAFCFFIEKLDNGSVGIPIIFILAVFLISRFTTGYIFGFVSSFISVLGVNYVFTYPYFEFNFTLTGYPVSIVSMLSVSIITSTLTTRIKKQEKIKIEAETEKMRSNLLRSVSHDLRTPLTSILGASSAIIENNEKISEEDKIKLVSEIKNDAQWLIQMVENLLSITKINSDSNAEITKNLEIAEEIVAESLAKFKKRFPDFPVTVSVPDDLIMIPMDAILIEQVLINLLENAAIHSKTATQTSLVVYTEKSSAVFEVHDNGVGVPKDILPHIFDGSIVHKVKSETDIKSNMGIGLSVCYTIIKVHGGDMTAHNSPSGGAVFKFTLPLDKKAAEI